VRYSKPLTLSNKLILGMVSFTVLGLLLAYIFVSTLVHNVVYDSILESTLRERMNQAQQVDAWFEEANHVIANLAEVLPLVDMEQYQDIVVHFLNRYNFIHSVWVALEDGRFYDSAYWVPPYDFVIQQRPWWLAAEYHSGEVAITLPYVSAETGEIIITVARHVRDWDSQEGVIALNIATEYFEAMMTAFQREAEGYLILIGPGREIIFHPNQEYMPTQEGLQYLRDVLDYIAVIDRFVAGDTVIDHRCELGNPYYFIQFPLPSTGWTFVSVIPATVASVPVQQILSAVILSMAVVLAVVFVLSLIFISVSTARESKLRQMRESNRAKSRFLAQMSHEIRTPITAVMGISEIQLRGQAMPPHTEEAFVKIYDSSKTLLRIINDILDFSKVESGRMSLTEKEYDVASLISDTAQLRLVYLENKDISFQVYIDEQIPVKMVGDALRIRQIINNLLTNSFKYTESGIVRLSLRCEEAEEEGYVKFIVAVQDTGIGMSEKQIEALKDNEYLRLHENEKPYVVGTGLGLSIVYSLAQIMNAQFEIKSKVGKGSLATICIPQKIASPEVLGKETAERLQNFESSMRSVPKKLDFEAKPMPHGKILVVDDVETNLYVVEAMLDTFELNTELCKNGQEAINKIKQGKVYDIIFMDHMMPGMDGIEVTRILRDTGYDRPIVALTANAMKGQAEMFMNNGFSGFMSKPVDINLLYSYLMRYVKS